VVKQLAAKISVRAKSPCATTSIANLTRLFTRVSLLARVKISVCDREPYYKSKLELKSNSNEILPVNCKFTCDSILQLKLTKLKLEVLKSDFQRKNERYEHRYTCN